MAAPVEFWFEFASTYSYVAAMRLEAEARAHGVELRWVPFLLGPVFTERLGIKDSPFNAQPVRGQYMWRDLERLCAEYGLPWRRPSVFPRNSTLATRIATVALDEPWGKGFVRAVYTANFADDREISDRAVLGELLRKLGQDPDAILARAEGADARALLRTRTQEAMQRGVFGAPNFFVEGDLFFGQDRMAQAFEAAKGTAPWIGRSVSR